jgi:hypothetical protein
VAAREPTGRKENDHRHKALCLASSNMLAKLERHGWYVSNIINLGARLWSDGCVARLVRIRDSRITSYSENAFYDAKRMFRSQWVAPQIIHGRLFQCQVLNNRSYCPSKPAERSCRWRAGYWRQWSNSD